ncbi:MAG: HAD-IIA family hydrolase [Corynebacterium glucuronolyticum]|nr:HAD-IIA family hydrolase [Mycobacteriaceae bacterium]MDY5833753.1 HAD-IIA family hydrolase [Corynebacterium glucuronolyticum]
MRLIDCYDALLLDLDGTVWMGDEPIPHAVDALAGCATRKMYVTNNASRGPEAVAAKLEGMGFEATRDEVLTSAMAAIDMCKRELPSGKVLVLGTESFVDLVREAGYEPVSSADDHPVAVLQGHNPETGWKELSEASLAIHNGALFFTSNLDATLPQERGMMVGNGSMVEAVVHATGVRPKSAGKPGAEMFHEAARKLGSRVPLAVGDRLNTDIAGGNAAGMDTLHVMTGVSGHHALVAAAPEERPSLIATDLRDLYSPLESLKPSRQGDFSAMVKGRDVVLAGGRNDSTAMQALRTVLEVVWNHEGPTPTSIIPTSTVAEQVLAEWR